MDLRSAVIKCLREVISTDGEGRDVEITEQTGLEEVGLDSMGFGTLMTCLEAWLGRNLSIEMAVAEELETVGDLVRACEKLVEDVGTSG